MGRWGALHSVSTYFVGDLSIDFKIEAGQGRQHTFL
jgi:hypothetical protein